jgi:hypothetical protein
MIQTTSLLIKFAAAIIEKTTGCLVTLQDIYGS